MLGTLKQASICPCPIQGLNPFYLATHANCYHHEHIPPSLEELKSLKETLANQGVNGHNYVK